MASILTNLIVNFEKVYNQYYLGRFDAGVTFHGKDLIDQVSGAYGYEVKKESYKLYGEELGKPPTKRWNWAEKQTFVEKMSGVRPGQEYSPDVFQILMSKELEVIDRGAYQYLESIKHIVFDAFVFLINSMTQGYANLKKEFIQVVEEVMETNY